MLYKFAACSTGKGGARISITEAAAATWRNNRLQTSPQEAAMPRTSRVIRTTVKEKQKVIEVALCSE